jgi:hypothetical protein
MDAPGPMSNPQPLEGERPAARPNPQTIRLQEPHSAVLRTMNHKLSMIKGSEA